MLELLSKLQFTHDRFRGQLLKRGYAQFGFSYLTSGRRLEKAAPLPDFLAPIIEQIKGYCPVGTEFNQCIVTDYPKGAGIGWHTDASCFSDTIVGVSFGTSARFQFRVCGTEKACYELEVSPGSIYSMTGDVHGTTNTPYFP